MRRRTRITCALSLVVAVAVSGTVSLSMAASRAQDLDMATVPVTALQRSAHGARSAAIRLPLRADLLGARWRGPASIELRAKGARGGWSGWVELTAAGDGPDPTSREGRRAAVAAADRVAASPVWVGDAEQVQVRAHGSTAPTRVQVIALNATGTATRTERAATSLRQHASWVLGATAQAKPVVTGGIRSRAAWQASPPRTTPAYADAVRGVVVHHTVGTNRYSCAQVPALLRGIQMYHMRSNGWNDIGYNFLVDRCGGVWEGRAGGTTKPVIGAHAAGFNTSTSGIALLGTHTTVRPTARERLSLQRLVAWRLDIAHVNPTGAMSLTALSSDKFAFGSTVRLRAVSGHRDVFPTSCPGAMTYRELGLLARRAWSTGGAKVANVTTPYRLRDPDDDTRADVLRVFARAVASTPDQTLSFRFERISTGELLHEQSGSGRVVQARWQPAADQVIPVWDVRVVVNGERPNGQRARPATVNVLPVAANPAFTVTTPPQASVSPNGDGIDDELVLAYTLGLDYRLGAWLHDPETGDEIAELVAPHYVGPTPTPRELRLAIPADIAAGTYELRVGLPADDAVGRSIYRAPLTVTE